MIPPRSRARQPPLRPASTLFLLLVAAAAGICGSAALAERPAVEALAIDVRGPLFAGSDLVVEVRQSGALAGKRLALQLAVDGVSVGRFEASGDRTTLRAQAHLTAGRHEVLVKSGSVRVGVTVRVWPAWFPWLGGLLLAGALVVLVRRSLRRPSSPQTDAGAG